MRLGTNVPKVVAMTSAPYRSRDSRRFVHRILVRSSKIVIDIWDTATQGPLEMVRTSDRGAPRKALPNRFGLTNTADRKVAFTKGP